jgi:hypothetical protein
MYILDGLISAASSRGLIEATLAFWDGPQPQLDFRGE